MKIINFIFFASFFVVGTFFVGCNSAATVFANRSVLHISTPKLLGERAYVTGSPTSANSNVQADKEYDLDTKANISGTGTVNDTSTNNQEATPTEAEKPAEKNTEADKK